MTERTEFLRLVRDCLSNLHDFAALETHPLTALFPKPPGEPFSQGEYLRQRVLQAVERLRPAAEEPPSYRSAQAACRPYLILHGRYIEGLGLRELQARLSLSERQLRREHSRALRAVAALLSSQVTLTETSPAAQELALAAPESPQWDRNLSTYEITLEPLDVAEVARSVAATLERRVQSEGTQLSVLLGQRLPLVLADRVLLRQILLSLFGYALDMRVAGRVALRGDVRPSEVALWIEFQTDTLLIGPRIHEEHGATLTAVRSCAQRIQATLQEARPAAEGTGLGRLVLTLARADRSVVLVVDDQAPAVRMFRRYLSQTNLQVVGVQDPALVLPLARRLKPQAITLDIMMPATDGWEILQALKADPETRHIPVVVCSVWDEPELAFSLGAAQFLKKPITQKALLDALAELRLVDRPAGSSREDTSTPPRIRGARTGGIA